jgi:hypothetical protein
VLTIWANCSMHSRTKQTVSAERKPSRPAKRLSVVIGQPLTFTRNGRRAVRLPPLERQECAPLDSPTVAGISKRAHSRARRLLIEKIGTILRTAAIGSRIFSLRWICPYAECCVCQRAGPSGPELNRPSLGLQYCGYPPPPPGGRSKSGGSLKPG